MNNKIKKIMLITVSGFVFIILVFLFYLLANDRDYRDNKIFKQLRRHITQIEENNESNDNLYKYDYSYLCEINPDIVGWIRISGTTIDYPVMQSETKDYYLNHNFYKQTSTYGVPYIPAECSVSRPSDNIIIYGHHIKGGQMFAALNKYNSRAFYEKHRFIEFDRITDEKIIEGTYEIIAVFKTTVYNDSEFKYYAFIDAENKDEFNTFIDKCKALSLYEYNSYAEYGDKLITLSTCEYSHENGRLVVVAKSV